MAAPLSLSDLRHALRGLRRQPGFTAAAVLTLALGLGASAAIFSLVEAALLRPLPYPRPERLVRVIGARLPAAGSAPENISAQDFLDFARESRSLEVLGAHGWTGGGVTLTGGGEAERVPSALVSSGLLRALGVQPAAGRFFRPDEDRPRPPRIVVISHGLWTRRFAADPRLIGSAIRLNGMPAVVIGVLPAGFRFPEADTLRASHPPDVLRLIDFDPHESSRTGRFLQAVGRLRSGIGLAAAETELRAIAARLERLHPAEDFGRSMRLVSLTEDLAGGAGPVLLLLLAAVACLLLVACANVANLLLARGMARHGEMAVRTALGATAGRLVQMLLVESLALAAIGGMLGVGAAAAAIRLLSAWGAGILPHAASAGLNARVVLFSLALTAVTGLVFGLAPAWQSARQGPGPALRQAAAGAGTSRSAAAARRGLVVAEVALALVLLIGAGLLIESYWRLRRVDPGFSPERVIAADLALPLARYPEGTESRFYERLYERAASLPGVEAAGGVNILPLDGNYSCDGIQIAEHPVPAGQEPCAEARSASPGYFRAMGIPLVAGRTFDSGDTASSARVIIVNQAMARRFWPGEDPLGKTLTYLRDSSGGPRRVVGVVGDVRHFGLDREPAPELYTPQPQPPSFHGMTVVLRARTRPAALLAALRREVAALDPLVPVYRTRTLAEMVSADAASPRLRTAILGAFAALALLLAMIGIYGVLACIVGQRTREIGIRRALGAGDGHLLRMLLGQTMAPALAGVGLGLVAALAATRLLSGLLFGVAPADPLLFTACPLLLTAAALAASWLPSRRAARIEPRVALAGDSPMAPGGI
jgi:putative ABC transport system permease protein